MNLYDLLKATLLCGGASFCVYSYPALNQGVVITLLAALWLSYARQTVRTLRRRWVG
jgi:hypothetical protein